jgi:hypothetical protein
MSKAVLEDTQRAGDYKESNQSSKTVTVKFSSVITRTSVGTVGAVVKSVETNSSKSESLSRVRTRRFTGSHVVEIGDLQSTNFTGMNSSAVISAWGLSRPGVNLLATYLDIHRVSSANIFDFTPTDSDLFQGVGNCDSFIEEGDLGTNKAQVKGVGDQEGPRDRDCNSSGSFGIETLTNNSSAENVDSTSKEVTTSRTVHLRITHTSSLSRKVLR